MISFFHFFSQKLRLSNPWRYKVPLLMSFTYVMLLTGTFDGAKSAISVLAAIVTTVGFSGFGYLTNDLADRKKDALAGKSNGVSNVSRGEIGLLLLVFLILALGPWFYLPVDNISIVCILAELLLFVLYAFPPVRLKEKGVFGVITDALYAHVLPGFLASWTFFLAGGKMYDNFVLFAIGLCVWQLFSGVRNIVSHHYKDFDNDQASGTRTFGTIHGKEKVYEWMVRFFIPLEVISCLFFLFVVQLEIDFLVFILVIFVLFARSNFNRVKNNGAETNVKHFTNEFLDRFYIQWFPLIVLLALTFGNYFFWWISILHFVCFFPIASFFRKRFSRSRETNDHRGEDELTVRKTAVISPNRQQYSETFIHGHIEFLPNAIVYSDGYFPQVVSLDRGKSWSKLGEKECAESELIQSWRDHGVEVILAEYGLAGVEVMHACEKANVPLIVHFHGFDAYRDDVLKGPGKNYPELFEKAAKIIVVSKDMRMQLIKLGCPAEKLEHITYGVDTDVFNPSQKIDKREHFIACGRFVAKKSPLITIQAFATVVEKFPDAKLTFIGDGELYDTVVALAVDLGMVDRIDFKGVLSPTEVALELQKHAIFVQHSVMSDEHDSEGTPLSILEAAASGLAIVATRHGGISDVIVNNESGILVEEGDVQAMADAMMRLCENKTLAQQLGHEARRAIVSNYTRESYLLRLNETLQSAQVPQKNEKESRGTVWKYRAIVFVALFLVVEIGLRIVGYKPGVIEDFYFHRQSLVYDSILYSDEVGITHLTSDAHIISNGVINREGFMSEFEFTEKSMTEIRKSGKKIVMLIGDSYTQGCCADSYDQSFASLLNNSHEFVVLNFGIPGADPVQYRLIVEKYAPLLKPDLILVAIYGGNDIMSYDRSAKPYIPLAYPVKSGPWLNSEGPTYLTKKGTYFKNFDEAKVHYFEYFSLWSDQSSFLEKNIRYSVILSLPYMKWKRNRRFKEIEEDVDELVPYPRYSRENLMRLQERSVTLGIPVIFTLIPSPSDVETNINVRKKYDFVFGKMTWYTPHGLTLNDYDGSHNANHFNNDGHRKYAAFLRNLIEGKRQK